MTVQNLTYPAGRGTKPARVYKPANATGTGLPVVDYYHGGGWVIAELGVYDAMPSAMAKALNAVVVFAGLHAGSALQFGQCRPARPAAGDHR